MPVATVGSPQTFILGANDALIVSCSATDAVASVAGSTGFIGAPYELGRVVGEQGRQFGPYGRAVSLIVSALAGSIQCDASSPSRGADGGAALSSQQAAGAQAMLSGDWTGVIAPDHRAKFTLRGTPYASLWQGTDSVLNQYTRSGVSSIHDHQGYMHIIRADELGYEGLRRVENLAADARNFTTGWTVEGSTTRTPLGANAGVTLSRGTASTTMITLNSQTYEQDLHVVRVDAWAVTGSVVLRIRCERTSDSANAGSADITCSTTRFPRGITFTPLDGTAHRINIGIVSGGTAFNLDRFMVQRKANQVPHPDDFVTRGESGAAWPFQGAGVDGVQYFDYEAVNFLEADGNIFEFTDRPYISESVFKGLRRFPSATQRLLRTADLTAITATTPDTTTPWEKVNLGTVARVTSVLNPIGRAHCYLLPETATTGAFELFQAWSGTVPAVNAPIPNAWYVRRGPGRTWVRISTRLLDGSTTRSAWFDLQRGVWGTVDSAIDPADLYAYPTGINDWWRIGFTVQAGASGSTAPRFTIAVASDDGVSSYAGVAGSGLYVAAPLATEGDHVSAYIGHTTSSVITRADGNIEIPITSNVPANNFTFHLDFTPMGSRTDTKLKTGFWYIAYSYFDNNNRWGTCLRPGVAGGNAGNRDAAGWAQDYYPNTVGFDGVQVRAGLIGTRGNPIKQFFGQADVARNSAGGGSFMTIGNIKGYLTTTAVASTAPIANKQSYIRLGSSLTTGKHDMCFKNVVIWHRALSDAEMFNGGSYR